MSHVDTGNKEDISDNFNLPPTSKSPNRVLNRRLSAAVETTNICSPGSSFKRSSNIGFLNYHTSQDAQSSQLGELKDPFDSQRKPPSPRSVNDLFLIWLMFSS